MFENFVFDATGNWLTYERDDNGDQVWDLSQTRTHNKANEITCLDSSHTNIAHDRNGNMTKMPKPNDWNAAFTCVYDAWNRLVQVKDGNTVTATYKYNGLNQRIRKTAGTVATQSVFNRNWQELESKTAGVTTTYVWGLRYIDDLVCRDRGDERIYAIQDANWNVTAITDTNGVVKERIAYNAFGKPTWLDVNHGPKTTSAYSWNRTFTGQVFDLETGLMLYRNRFYHAELGRFVTRDLIGYNADDENLYRYVRNQVITSLDPWGLDKGCYKWNEKISWNHRTYIRNHPTEVTQTVHAKFELCWECNNGMTSMDNARFTEEPNWHWKSEKQNFPIPKVPIGPAANTHYDIFTSDESIGCPDGCTGEKRKVNIEIVISKQYSIALLLWQPGTGEKEFHRETFSSTLDCCCC